MRSLILLIYDYIINSYIIIRNIISIRSKKTKFIFYSENKSYLKYSYQLIELLSKKFPNQVYYISSDMDDKIIDLDIKNFFIGSGFLMQYFFMTLKTENLFLTLTDLGNHSIKKTKNIKNYIYFFHAPISTTRGYTDSAFDNYDIILCNGDYQINEIKKREIIKKYKKKELIKTGYFYFDYLKEKINYQKKVDEILIAPSWNYNQENFMNKNLEIIIEQVLKKGFKVRFRPHPENFKRSKHILNFFEKKFKSEDFILDDSPGNKESMERAKCLITDNSGIAIEYTLLFKKPVLYFEDVQKIHNKEYDKFSDLVTMEDSVKDKFGYTFKKNQINNIDTIINNSILDFKNKDEEIKDFINKNFFNFGNTLKKFENLMLKIF